MAKSPKASTPAKAPKATAKPRAPAVTMPTRPERRIQWVWFLRGVGIALFYSLPIAFMVFQIGLINQSSPNVDVSKVIPRAIATYFLVWGVLVFLLLVWTSLAVRRYSFEIGEEDVLVRKGVVFRTTSRIPLLKVQDIHVRQGPLLRMFGLASLKLETAGSVAGAGGHGPGRMIGAEGQIPGILNAEQVADALLQRVKKLRGGL